MAGMERAIHRPFGAMRPDGGQFFGILGFDADWRAIDDLDVERGACARYLHRMAAARPGNHR
jgi:hypothetical protein